MQVHICLDISKRIELKQRLVLFGKYENEYCTLSILYIIIFKKILYVTTLNSP